MGLSNQFKTDDTLETKGVVLDYGTTRIRIARAGGANKRFGLALAKATKPHKRSIQAGIMDQQLSDFLLRDVYSRTVVIGWETKGEDGEFKRGIDPVDIGEPAGDLLSVSPENVLRVFNHLPDLFNDVQLQAQEHAIFRAELDEASAGNS